MEMWIEAEVEVRDDLHFTTIVYSKHKVVVNMSEFGGHGMSRQDTGGQWV